MLTPLPMVARFTFGLALLSLLVGCRSSKEPGASQAGGAALPKAAPSASASEARKSFGAPLGKSPATALSEVLRDPEKFADQTVLVDGHVRKACSRKGCWMELAETADDAGAGCRVTFKDYGFFVPTDAAGSRARVEAAIQSKVIKASQVAHLEEEGARFADKAADGSAREIRLVASGVELWR